MAIRPLGKNLCDVFKEEGAVRLANLPVLGQVRRPKRLTKRELAEMTAVVQRCAELVRTVEAEKAMGNPYNRMQFQLNELAEWARHLGNQASYLSKLANRQLDLLES